jgi:hypothetical protein
MNRHSSVTWRLFAASILFCFFAPLLGGAQENAGEAEPDERDLGDGEQELVAEVAAALEQQGWSEQERNAFLEAAREQNWNGLETEDPAAVGEIVGLAMEFVKRSGTGLGMQDQAAFARELARNAVAMRAVGLERQDIARATLRGARNTVRALERRGPRTEQQSGNGEPPAAQAERGRSLGKTIRRNVEQAMRNQVGKAAAERARERRDRGRGNAPGVRGRGAPGGPPLGPPGTPGRGVGGGKPDNPSGDGRNTRDTPRGPNQ